MGARKHALGHNPTHANETNRTTLTSSCSCFSSSNWRRSASPTCNGVGSKRGESQQRERRDAPPGAARATEAVPTAGAGAQCVRDHAASKAPAPLTCCTRLCMRYLKFFICPRRSLRAACCRRMLWRGSGAERRSEGEVEG